MKKATRSEKQGRPHMADHSIDVLDIGRIYHQPDGAMTKQEPETKISRILAVLASGRSLNRIEALPHGDTVLNTTISTLRNRHNLTILDTWETHTGPNGSAPVKSYWIPKGEPAEKAQELLDFMRARARTKAGKGR